MRAPYAALAIALLDGGRACAGCIA